jgi:hypothetical protein
MDFEEMRLKEAGVSPHRCALSLLADHANGPGTRRDLVTVSGNGRRFPKDFNEWRPASR